MELIVLGRDFTVCKIHSIAEADLSGEYVFVAKTDDEVSLVCETRYTPQNAVAVETGWKALKIAGTLDFGMVGVISRITGILAQAELSVFVVSTYNTDYILVKASILEKCLDLLETNDYMIQR
ncbi:MAG: ACT domain-containing protein [Oscillospiraceae bacterium]|jgi:hypothetical protein|nr:ACT domain-containing protein [Oscillospiraceae bacterium]